MSVPAKYAAVVWLPCVALLKRPLQLGAQGFKYSMQARDSHVHVSHTHPFPKVQDHVSSSLFHIAICLPNIHIKEYMFKRKLLVLHTAKLCLPQTFITQGMVLPSIQYLKPKGFKKNPYLLFI